MGACRWQVPEQQGDEEHQEHRRVQTGEGRQEEGVYAEPVLHADACASGTGARPSNTGGSCESKTMICDAAPLTSAMLQQDCCGPRTIGEG